VKLFVFNCQMQIKPYNIQTEVIRHYTASEEKENWKLKREWKRN